MAMGYGYPSIKNLQLVTTAAMQESESADARLTTNSVIYSFRHHRVLNGGELVGMHGFPLDEIQWARHCGHKRSFWTLLAGWTLDVYSL